MIDYEIYWNDLIDEAKAKLKPIYHSNINLAPLAVIQREENSEVDSTVINLTFEVQLRYEIVSNSVLEHDDVAVMTSKIKESIHNSFPLEMTDTFIKSFNIAEAIKFIDEVNLVDEHTTHE